MTRAARRAKQHRRNARAQSKRLTQGGRAVQRVCVVELDGVFQEDSASSLLGRMGLPATNLLVAPGRPVLSVLRLQGPVNDCVLLAECGRVLGILHGSDCALSTAIGRHFGKSMPVALDGRCARRDAGGLFRVLDVDEMLD